MDPISESVVWNIVSMLVALVVGSGITWAVAKYHYEQAAEDLREESKELRRLR
jgi:type II secretory pathway component PulL